VYSFGSPAACTRLYVTYAANSYRTSGRIDGLSNNIVSGTVTVSYTCCLTRAVRQPPPRRMRQSKRVDHNMSRRPLLFSPVRPSKLHVILLNTDNTFFVRNVSPALLQHRLRTHRRVVNAFFLFPDVRNIVHNILCDVLHCPFCTCFRHDGGVVNTFFFLGRN